MLALRNFLQVIVFLKKHIFPARRILSDNTCYGSPREIANILQNGCLGLFNGLSSFEHVFCRQGNKLEPVTLVIHLSCTSEHISVPCSVAIVLDFLLLSSCAASLRKTAGTCNLNCQYTIKSWQVYIFFLCSQRDGNDIYSISQVAQPLKHDKR